MKYVVICFTLATLFLSASDCQHKATTRFKGRLEVKALCMNYTISVIDGNIDTALVVPSWTDETTGKSYHNVFRLGSPCTFPADINAGDEFYFTIDSSAVQNCAVCMAYYPTPPKKLPIKVIRN